ncbi:unnamed protein product [Acanthoscelides obtectus]|uniref:Mos1 transposase HTH domain-containing protein n=1 Tax=Acanthoscelides obtectus TaxID=200917 RepID=A0A9P0KP79_ACAOB|nr:unnamed protein product [Acanthoscelides obtectus]CAK1671893.1 Histone-lysine N-methyltransferase SETMAR [Acanthoscelides obtectus]
MELNREDFRAIIYYNFQRQLSQQDGLAELLSVLGNEAPHQSTISRWYGEFKRGRVSLSDDFSVGAPKTAVAQENVDAVRNLIIEDRHMTYREIEASLKISNTSIEKILHEELGARKLVSRWIPHLLTEEHKSARVNCVVSGDESWISCYEPENKRQSAVWVFQGEEKPTTGHTATIRLNEQRTATADWYITICLPKPKKTRQYLTEENVELLDHPPYINTFKKAGLDLPANEWNKCYDNWFERMQMCINLRGE